MIELQRIYLDLILVLIHIFKGMIYKIKYRICNNIKSLKKNFFLKENHYFSYIMTFFSLKINNF